MSGVVSVELPQLTAGNFEHTLASDDVLAHFFNNFLSLPSFPEALQYNQANALFEVVSGEAELISRRIRSVLHQSKSQLLTGDLTRAPLVDNCYTVWCLDKKQGIQWIIEERLPLFLQSDFYIEYRLAKLLFQWEPNQCVQRKKLSSVRTTHSAPRLLCSSQFDRENNDSPEVLTISPSSEDISLHQVSMTKRNLRCPHSGQEEHLNTKCRESSRCFSSCSEPEKRPALTSLSWSCSSLSNLKCDEPQDVQTPQIEGSVGNLEMHHLKDSRSQSCEPEQQLEYLAARVVKQVLHNALKIINDQSQGSMSDCFNKPGHQTNCTSREKWCERELCQHSANGGREETKKVEEVTAGSQMKDKTDWDEKNSEVRSWGTDQENACDICYHGACCQDNRPGLDEFREYLRGTPGEKRINLWVDIEKLKALQHREQKSRYLALMRSRYLLSSSQSCLNTQQLSTLGLTTSPCWTEEKLCSVQACLTEALLCYWAPRFWESQCAKEAHDDITNVGMWTEWWNSPLSNRQPHGDFLSLSLLLPDTCSTPASTTVHSQLHSGRSQFVRGREMETMIQALFVDSCAGSYFTHFCVQSGNQLWENAVYFWTDLQHYHELFYQEGLDAYRVQREAQLLYATYLYISARRSIGVDEETRRRVYERLKPAFEELFDEVEEHVLNILLQPWTLLVSRDKESFQKVRVHEEVHRVDSQEFRELQSVHEESERQLREVKQSTSVPSLSPAAFSAVFSKGPRTSDSWSKVSPNYQGYRLGSLLRHRHEIGHFMSFLQKQDASIHLACWLDLEQYRRTPQKNRAVKQERSSHIAAKYLNRKYFFGPDSPASTEQQNNILRLAGGLEHLKLECLSNLVVEEIQDTVRSHIEKTWLPQFLSTAEFTERQGHGTQQLYTADRLSQHVLQQRRLRRKSWKANSLWMSSSKEILLFRQILLNPVTCMEFQHFVSLKGDFLENDLLFWLEVQRYKDLCHSHSDEATIQQKISTIINCFINSSVPPPLQIDIPPEQAQHILDKRHELGPYIFREAQMSVFGELLKFWPEFVELRRSVQDEQLLPLLQKQHVKHRARVRRQKRREEEEDERRRKAQEACETQISGFREAVDADSDTDDAEEQEGGSGKTWRTQGSELLFPTQPLSWSYSKYMAAQKREEVLLSRKSQLESSFSIDTVSSCCSVQSVDSEQSHRVASHHTSTTDSKQCNRRNSGERSWKNN